MTGAAGALSILAADGPRLVSLPALSRTADDRLTSVFIIPWLIEPTRRHDPRAGLSDHISLAHHVREEIITLHARSSLKWRA